jgi:hypothetical protein
MCVLDLFIKGGAIMKRSMLIVFTVLFVMLNGVPAQAGTSQFDGTWNVKFTCKPTVNAPGYTYNFAAQVKDGMFLGQYGEENKPGHLKITGQIEPDGSAMLQATGETGKSAPKGFVQGQSYTYAIKAQFSGSRGTGSRMQTIRSGQRNCDFLFIKQ